MNSSTQNSKNKIWYLGDTLNEFVWTFYCIKIPPSLFTMLIIQQSTYWSWFQASIYIDLLISAQLSQTAQYVSADQVPDAFEESHFWTKPPFVAWHFPILNKNTFPVKLKWTKPKVAILLIQTGQTDEYLRLQHHCLSFFCFKQTHTTTLWCECCLQSCSSPHVCLWYVFDWGLQVGLLPQPWIQIRGYSVIQQQGSLEDSFNLIASGSPTLPPAPAPTAFTPISQSPRQSETDTFVSFSIRIRFFSCCISLSKPKWKKKK